MAKYPPNKVIFTTVSLPMCEVKRLGVHENHFLCDLWNMAEGKKQITISMGFFRHKYKMDKGNVNRTLKSLERKGWYTTNVSKEPGKNPKKTFYFTKQTTALLGDKSVVTVTTPSEASVVTVTTLSPVTVTTHKVTIKELTTIEGANAPVCENESFSTSTSHGSASTKKRAGRETATSYTTTAAFDAFWELVRYSKGDRFPAWQTWRRLDIEGKGLADKVVAALKGAVVEWQRREPKYRPRVAKWLGEGSWQNNGQDDEPMMTDEEFKKKFPSEEALKRYEDRQRERFNL